MEATDPTESRGFKSMEDAGLAGMQDEQNRLKYFLQAWKIYDSIQLEKLTNQVENPLEFISIAFEIEKVSAGDDCEVFWLFGLEKFQHSTVYLEALSHYYYSIKRYDRVLHFLKTVLPREPARSSIRIALYSAFELADFVTVWEYYQLFEAADRDNLESELNVKVAIASRHLGKNAEADLLFALVKNNFSDEELYLMQKKADIPASHKHSARALPGEEVQDTSLQDWLTFGYIMMAQKN